jgi:hypothetical protein
MKLPFLIACLLTCTNYLKKDVLLAQSWTENAARVINGHLNEYKSQTVIIQIISSDTTLEFVNGPRASNYHSETCFRAGYLLMLSQAWFIAQMETRQKGFIDQKVLGDITLKQLLTHRSGYPRFPWEMKQCNEEALISFVSQYVPPKKPSFQLSFTGISLTEKWLRSYFSEYPGSVFDSWGIQPFNEVKDSSRLAHSKIIKQSLPIDCWPFCMSCSTQGLYLTKQDAGRLVKNILEKKEEWKLLMQPEAQTPLPHLRMALGFQIAENIKKLPLAMLASSDNGNAVFIGISPNSNTGIIILGDTDEPLDNLGLKLMALFHRDILNFKP